MQIETSRFGPLEIDESTFIHFPWGIPGFEHIKRYVLIEHRNGPFQWLQSVDAPDTAFVVCPPEVLNVSYRVPDKEKEKIRLEKEEDLLILVMVSFQNKDKAFHPHFKGPLLFNSSLRVAFQLVMDSKEVKRCLTFLEP